MAKKFKFGKIFRFLAGILFFGLIFRFLYENESYTDFLREITIDLTKICLQVMGVSVLVKGSYFLQTPHITIEIIRACSGWRGLFFLFSLILSTPNMSFRKKIKGLFFLPLYYIFNIFRLVFIVFSVKIFPNSVQFIHDVIWTNTSLILTILLWLFWFKNENQTKTK